MDRKARRHEAFDELSHVVIGCAIEVHRELGPGLLESAYEQCLAWELSQKGVTFERQVDIPVRYKAVDMDCSYRADMIIGGQILVELKSVEALLPIHKAQVLTYLKLTGLAVGLLINFNESVLKNGVRRLVNNGT